MPTTTIARKGFGSQPDDLAVDTGAPVRRQQSGVDWTCGNGKGEPVVGRWSGVDHLNAPGT
jgi:hypothetical protein